LVPPPPPPISSRFLISLSHFSYSIFFPLSAPSNAFLAWSYNQNSLIVSFPSHQLCKISKIIHGPSSQFTIYERFSDKLNLQWVIMMPKFDQYNLISIIQFYSYHENKAK
jgi:hypothetical protein